MNDAWKRFRADFNAMTDDQVEYERQQSQEEADRAEDWLEAVASWEAAGRPRDCVGEVG